MNFTMKLTSTFSRKLLIPLFLIPFLLISSARGQTHSSGVTSDGRDFYIGFVMPSFMINPPSSAGKDVGDYFHIVALISSYDNDN